MKGSWSLMHYVPDIDDDEFADELLVPFALRKPTLLEFALPKVEFIPPSGVSAYEEWLSTRMAPTPVVVDGEPVLDDDGTPKTEPREPISDKEVYVKQIEVALFALAREHKTVITPAKAKKVIERLEAAPIGQVRWIYQTWSDASESSVGESEGSSNSSQETTEGPSGTTS